MFTLQPQLSNGSNGLRTADHDNSQHYLSLLDITICQEDGDTFNQDLIDFDNFKVEKPTLSNFSSTSNSSAVPFQTKTQYQPNTSIFKSPPSNFTSQVPAQESANKVLSAFSNEFAKTTDQSVDSSAALLSPSPSELVSFGLNQDNTNSFPASPVQSQDQSITCRAPPCDQDSWTSSSVNHLNCPPSSNYSDILLGETGVAFDNCSEPKIISPVYPVHDADVAKKNSVHCDEELFNGIDTKDFEGPETIDASKISLGFGNLQVQSQETRPNSQQFAVSNCKAKNPTKHYEIQHVRENVEVQHISNGRKFYFYPLLIPSGRLYKDEKIDVENCVHSFKKGNRTKYRCNHHKCASDHTRHTFSNKEKCLQHIQQEHFGWKYRCPHPGCTANVTKYHNMIEKHSQTTHDRLMHLSSAKMVKGEWHDHYGPPVEVTMGESNPPPKPRTSTMRQSNVLVTSVAAKRFRQQKMM